MNLQRVAELERLQDASGCFPSRVSRGDQSALDYNGFTAAIVLRTLRRHAGVPALQSVTRRALDYLKQCRSTRVSEAFAFWPDALRPTWAASVPADLDDTALMSTELLRAGCIEPEQALASACRVLVVHRVCETEQLPSWVQAGAFFTWLAPRRAINMVDCCVNANVLALLSLIGAGHLPGYQAAIATIQEGVAWAAGNEARLRTLTPFYPSCHDLCDALEHAVECGVTALRGCHARLVATIGPRPMNDDDSCCCCAYGRTVWRCRAIGAARALVSES